MARSQTGRRESLVLVGAGGAIALILVVLCFPDLFWNGRIWAEEGAAFLAHILQQRTTEHPDSWIYLHHGHWELWTLLTALLAAQAPHQAGRIFTWFSLIPQVIACMAMLRYSLVRLADHPPDRGMALLLGFTAMLVSLLAGGPEVFANTTNSHWFFCVYLFFSILTSERLGTRQPTPKSNPVLRRGALAALDVLAMLSSFSAVVLLPIQIIVMTLVHHRFRQSAWPLNRTRLAVARLSCSRPGLTAGFLIQIVTTILLHSSSADERSLMLPEATRGFLLQGLFGLWIPWRGALHSLAWFLQMATHHISPASLIGWLIVASVVCGCLLAMGVALRDDWGPALVLLVMTFAFANLALGDKSPLINPGSGMRYFATERIGMAWLLVTQVAISCRGQLTLRRLDRPGLYALALCLLIGSSSITHFRAAEQISMGLAAGGCQTATQQTLARLKGGWSSAEAPIPICPQGWSLPNLPISEPRPWMPHTPPGRPW
jgi:hypothetical protein